MASPLDLFGAWREAVQKIEQELNANLTAAAADEGVSRVMNSTLSLYARLQAAQAEAMEKALARANLPSKADFRHLHERFDALEAQIGALAQQVERIARASGAVAERPAAPQVARTRKPPGAAKGAVEPAKPPPPAAARPARKTRKATRPSAGSRS